MQWDVQEQAYFGRCSDGKHVRVERETFQRVQQGKPELTPDMWAAQFDKESGIDLEFSSSQGMRTPSIGW